jgi:hypothetical protein
MKQLLPLQHGCPRLPHDLHVPLEHTFPLLHAEPLLQQGSPLPPHRWHVLPGPKGLRAQTCWKVQAGPVVQHGSPELPHGSQRLNVGSHAYPDPANGHCCQSKPGQQVPNDVPQSGRQVPLWQPMLVPQAAPLVQQACPLPPHTRHVPPMHWNPPLQVLPGQHTCPPRPQTWQVPPEQASPPSHCGPLAQHASPCAPQVRLQVPF